MSYSIDIAALSDRQKMVLQKVLEQPQQLTFDVLRLVVRNANNVQSLSQALSRMNHEQA